MKTFFVGIALAGLVLLGFRQLTKYDEQKKLVRAFSTPYSSPPENTPAYHIIAYVLGDRLVDANKIKARRITHINYAFLDVKNAEIRSFLPYDERNLRALNQLKIENPDLKILISLGGWTRSKGFSDAALTEDKRTKLAKSCVKFIKDYHIDGIDIDWEYPGLPGGGNPHRPEDKENFTLLLKTIRKHLDQQSLIDKKPEGERYLLTIAAGAGQQYIDHTDMASASEYLDFVNVMTYDYSGGWSDSTAHHSNLFSSTFANASDVDSDMTIKMFLNAGVPHHKLVMGAPFFGRAWHNVTRKQNGLRQKAGKSAGSVAYHVLEDRFIEKRGYKRYWDDRAKVPYLWNDTRGIFVSYDDSLSIALKAQYVKEQQLAGAMFWEYFRDTTGVLLDAMYVGLKEKGKDYYARN